MTAPLFPRLSRPDDEKTPVDRATTATLLRTARSGTGRPCR